MGALQSAAASTDPKVAQMAQSLMHALNNPLNNLKTVSEFLNFVTGPLSPNSSLALGLHQWAFMLLCLRFEQLGKEVRKFLKDRGQNLSSALSSEIGANSRAKLSEGSTSQLLRQTFGFVERLKEECTLLQGFSLPSYLPLPAQSDGAEEGALGIRHDDKEKTWHLNFLLDLNELGPLQVKAEAKLPELKLSFKTPKPQTQTLIQSMLPALRGRLQDLGITTRSSLVVMGEVDLKYEKQEAYAKSDHGKLDIKTTQLTEA